MSKVSKKIRTIIAVIMAIAIQCTTLSPMVVNATETPTVDVAAVEDVSPRSRELTAIGDGTISIYPLGEFKFTNSNLGAYNTIKASRAKYRVEIKPLPGESIDFEVYCYQYGGKEMAVVRGGNYGHQLSDGYYLYESSWFDVVYGVDYRLKYWCREACLDNPSTMYVRVTMYVQ